MCYCVCVCSLPLVYDRDGCDTRYVLHYCVCFPSATSRLFDSCVKFYVIMDWFLILACFSKAANMLKHTYYTFAATFTLAYILYQHQSQAA